MSNWNFETRLGYFGGPSEQRSNKRDLRTPAGHFFTLSASAPERNLPAVPEKIMRIAFLTSNQSKVGGAETYINSILPALKAGFVVLADRYIYTLMARDMVRGMDEVWLKNIYGVALEPDAVFYLNVPPEELVQRSFAKNMALDYWESGMDLGLSRDMFDSFMKYQTAMQNTFQRMQSTYGFTIVDGIRSSDAIHAELQKKIRAVLAGK